MFFHQSPRPKGTKDPQYHYGDILSPRRHPYDLDTLCKRLSQCIFLVKVRGRRQRPFGFYRGTFQPIYLSMTRSFALFETYDVRLLDTPDLRRN